MHTPEFLTVASPGAPPDILRKPQSHGALEEEEKKWKKKNIEAYNAPPGVCGGGEEVFLTNPGVLVTRVRTPFQPAIALRSCERLGVPYAHSLGLGGRHDRCPSAGRSPHRALHRCS